MHHTIEHVLLLDFLTEDDAADYEFDDLDGYQGLSFSFLNENGETEHTAINERKFSVPVCQRSKPLKEAVQQFIEDRINTSIISDVEFFGLENIYNVALRDMLDVIPQGECSEIGHIFVSRKMSKKITEIKNKDIKRWYGYGDSIAYDFDRRLIILNIPDNLIAFSTPNISFGVVPTRKNKQEYGIGVLSDRLLTYRLCLK
jgi:hypothetical protein